MKEVINNPIDEFAQSIKEGMKHWLRAGEIVREQMALNPDWPEEVVAKHPFLSVHTIRKFANIGLKYIPELAIDNSPGGKALAKLPIPLQQQYYTAPIPTLVYNNGNPEILQIGLHVLTQSQASQVFALDHIRSEAEQRAWLEDQSALKIAPFVPANLPYRIVGSKVVFMEGTQMTKSDLRKLIAEMK